MIFVVQSQQYKQKQHKISIKQSEMRGSYRSKIDKFLNPGQIYEKIILQINNNNESTSNREVRQEAMNIIYEQADKFELLRVTGREMIGNLAKKKPRNTHHGRSNKKMKVILKEPLNKLIKSISKDSQCQKYQEFTKIKKYEENISNSKHFLSELQSNYFSKNKMQTKTQNVFAQYNSKNQIRQTEDMNGSPVSQSGFYEGLIIQNPVLMEKMIGLYKTKRSQQRDNKILRKVYKKISPLKKQQHQFQFEKDNISPVQLKKISAFTNYRQFLFTINCSNQITVNPQSQVQYKAFICKGNNGLLVKSLIKNRPWWVIKPYCEINSCNIVWTEWKKILIVSNKIEENTQINLTKYSDDNLISTKTSSFESPFFTRFTKENKNSSKFMQVRQKCNLKALLKPINSKQQKFKAIYKLLDQNNQYLLNHMQQNSSDNYFTFTRKINTNKFEDLTTKLIPNICKNRRIKSQKVIQINNHLPGCLQLHSKKLLLKNLRNHYFKIGEDINKVIPQTFLIGKKGVQDIQWNQFSKVWQKNDSNPHVKKPQGNIWICKPGENSNRGNGITVQTDINQIKNLVKAKPMNKTMIIQKYMETPFLYCRRKFDIRCYILVTTNNGYVKAYWYQDGYLRTTSKQYNLNNLNNKFIHLTNDAIQKKGEEYGKFQNCNKVSFQEFQKYTQLIASKDSNCHNFQYAYQKMKTITKQMVDSVVYKLNPQILQHGFELFGIDFMLDEQLNPYLIQANSNPCLGVDGPILAKIIPSLIQNVLKIAVDPIYPPPYSESPRTSRYSSGSTFQSNKFILILSKYTSSSVLSKTVFEVDEDIENQFEEEVE